MCHNQQCGQVIEAINILIAARASVVPNVSVEEEEESDDDDDDKVFCSFTYKTIFIIHFLILLSFLYYKGREGEGEGELYK